MKALTKFCVLLVASFVLASCASVSKQPVFEEEGLANRGYDVVSYFTDNEAQLGSEQFSTRYNGVEWRFASAEHLEMFNNAPQQYAPQYGGYCAYAMSKGFVVSTDPQAFAIENGKLYLNYSLGVRETWLKDKPGYIEKANANWLEKTAEQ
ncbi:YHS domain-containing (seleno)protein [Paraferrimonas haliotis]|uniref:YHS domain-containing protein n=1 Tax=Paraferrimonas haliotis TaxID=2013866 RepID=A0AA37TKX0_9GAMM|nr:YHS domain-containing (seleno)protein [Paraferrimonas haliotis]GLS83084.1 hypothetical protein GCM10007894_10610 [Paraferrimonas haliotis]